MKNLLLIFPFLLFACTSKSGFEIYDIESEIERVAQNDQEILKALNKDDFMYSFETNTKDQVIVIDCNPCVPIKNNHVSQLLKLPRLELIKNLNCSEVLKSDLLKLLEKPSIKKIEATVPTKETIKHRKYNHKVN